MKHAKLRLKQKVRARCDCTKSIAVPEALAGAVGEAVKALAQADTGCKVQLKNRKDYFLKFCKYELPTVFSYKFKEIAFL